MIEEIEEVETTKLDELVKVYLTIRNERDRIEAERKAQIKELNDELAVLEQTFMATCNESNAKSIRTTHGTVIRKMTERFTVNNGESFRKFVLENGAVDLFEARIHQGNFKEFLKENAADGLPPGVNVMREFDISVRKPSN
jgi:uncharacterized membrane protein YqiK